MSSPTLAIMRGLEQAIDEGDPGGVRGVALKLSHHFGRRWQPPKVQIGPAHLLARCGWRIGFKACLLPANLQQVVDGMCSLRHDRASDGLKSPVRTVGVGDGEGAGSQGGSAFGPSEPVIEETAGQGQQARNEDGGRSAHRGSAANLVAIGQRGRVPMGRASGAPTIKIIPPG